MSTDLTWQEQIERIERSMLDTLPPEFEHVPDEDTMKYDAEFRVDYTSEPGLPVVGIPAVEAGTPSELKTCQEWINDQGARGNQNRRRGRWHVNRSTHEALLASDGVYTLCVMDGDRVLAGQIVPAEMLGEVASWTNGGKKYASQRAAIPWAKLIDPDAIEAARDDG